MLRPHRTELSIPLVPSIPPSPCTSSSLCLERLPPHRCLQSASSQALPWRHLLCEALPTPKRSSSRQTRAAPHWGLGTLSPPPPQSPARLGPGAALGDSWLNGVFTVHSAVSSCCLRTLRGGCYHPHSTYWKTGAPRSEVLPLPGAGTPGPGLPVHRARALRAAAPAQGPPTRPPQAWPPARSGGECGSHREFQFPCRLQSVLVLAPVVPF